MNTSHLLLSFLIEFVSRRIRVFKLRVLQCIQISLLGNNRTGYNNNRATALTVCRSISPLLCLYGNVLSQYALMFIIW